MKNQFPVQTRKLLSIKHLEPLPGRCPMLRVIKGSQTMKIVPLKQQADPFDCTPYLILGDWNRSQDMNTVIDPDSCDITDMIDQIYTGFGKISVKQVILTQPRIHQISAALSLKKRFGARVLSASDIPGIDTLVHDGQRIRAGDEFLEVIHLASKAVHSLCLYAPSIQALLAGNTPLHRISPMSPPSEEYRKIAAQLAGRRINAVFPGQGEPLYGDMLSLWEHVPSYAP